MAITLTNTGWFGELDGVLTSGIWSNGVDSITDENGSINVDSDTVAKTLAGDDTISGSGYSRYEYAIRILGAIDTGAGKDIIDAIGYYNGLENYGTIDTGVNNDTITASSVYGASIYNVGTINTGVGNNSIIGNGSANFCIYNNGTIIAAGGNDSIIGESNAYYNTEGNYTFGGGYGIFNDGTINAGGGNNYVLGKVFNGIGIYNSGIGTIETGNGSDTFIAMGNYYGAGFVNYGNISTGAGDDSITVTDYENQVDALTNFTNNGIIDTGAGSDSILVARGGFQGNGSVFLGTGRDYLSGFGSGFFNGGEGIDILDLVPQFYNVGISGKTVTLTGSSPYSPTMIVTDFEIFRLGEQTYNLANLPSQITD